ncbi:collagen alpha-1(XII) chain-like [Garra rufa]|uniref:collagen alpha-1(XII) chain-like n=1 Tax=Garra rufa TaxID=137080 RepID=UPI003CCE73A3
MQVRVQLILILTSVLITHVPADVFTCATPADIVILVDGSSSVSYENFETLKSLLEIFLGSFTVGSNQTRIGLVQYSGDPQIEWHLNSHSTKKAVINAVKSLLQKGGNTHTGLALTRILENSFKAESGSRPDVPKIVILITDGESRDDVLSPAQRLRDAGIELFTIVFLFPSCSSPVFTIMKLASINVRPRRGNAILEGYTTFIFQDGRDLEDYVEEFISICHLASCDDVCLMEGFWCGLDEDLRFVMPEGEPGWTLTQYINILLSAWGSELCLDEAEEDYNTVQSHHADVSQRDPEPSQLPPRPAEYQPEPTADGELPPAANSVPSRGGATEQLIVTEPEWHEASDQVCEPASVTATVKKSVEVENAKDSITHCTTTEGAIDADVNELRAIASPPQETHVYIMPDFSNMLDIIGELNMSVCERISELSREISVKIHTCETAAIADIVILVDGSWSISRLNFKTVRSFLGMFVKAFAVGSEQTRIGLVLYSKDSWIEWHLNTHRTKEAVISAVKHLPYKGGITLTGRGLTHILENSFKAQSGSRPDVPKIVILITDGKSQDDVLAPAQRLRDAGIELFAIGVKNADKKQLKAIASPPKKTHVYNAPDFSLMLDIMEGLTRSVCERISELNNAQSDAPSDLLTSEVTPGRFCVTRPVNL